MRLHGCIFDEVPSTSIIGKVNIGCLSCHAAATGQTKCVSLHVTWYRGLASNANHIPYWIQHTGRLRASVKDGSSLGIIPDSKVYGPSMGPIWGRQDPSGPQVGPMDLVIWDALIIYIRYLVQQIVMFVHCDFQHIKVCLLGCYKHL